MSKVFNTFNLPRRVAVKGDAGVEIEVEGNNLPFPEEYWNCERDGSLRGEAIEYVLRKPLNMPELRKALEFLDSCYKKNNTQVNESVRAGVHVHVNVQELSMIELFSFITAYIILEDLLIKYCGEYREGNLFCLRAKDAEYLLYIIEQAVQTKDYRMFDNDILRYSSMNVCSLRRYGSLEFRAMRGTRDLSLIGDWAEMLVGIRDAAVKFESAKQVVEFFNEDGAESFLEVFLGRYKDKICNGLPAEETLSEGLVRAFPLAMETDWDSFLTADIGGLEFPLGTEFPDEPLEDF